MTLPLWRAEDSHEVFPIRFKGGTSSCEWALENDYDEGQQKNECVRHERLQQIHMTAEAKLEELFHRLERLERKKASDRVWDLAGRVAVVIVLGVGSWMIGHEVRLSKIESNRFTDAAAIQLERRILQQLPPSWLREDITEIKAMLKDYGVRMRELEQKIR